MRMDVRQHDLGREMYHAVGMEGHRSCLRGKFGGGTSDNQLEGRTVSQGLIKKHNLDR